MASRPRTVPRSAPEFGYIVDKLAEAIARMEADASGGSMTEDAALLNVWCEPNFGAPRQCLAVFIPWPPSSGGWNDRCSR